MVGSWGPAAAGGKPRTQTDLRNTAVELRGKNLPVILYRVASKSVLKSDEKKAQTLSSSVHSSVGGTGSGRCKRLRPVFRARCRPG